MRIDCDALIVGGGPSGLSTGLFISKKGFKTIILEEHNEVGRPEQCAGLVSWRIGWLPQHLVLNKVDTARFCLGKESFEVYSKKEMLVIDRAGYDKYLAENALTEGVEIRLGERVVGLKEGCVVTSKGGHYSGRILVGADGPNSIVARLAGLKQPNNLLFALQCVANGVFEQDVVELRFDPEFSRDVFAWVIPLSRSKARVGLLTSDNPWPRLRLLLKRLNIGYSCGGLIGDSIRFGIMRRTSSRRVILVGDAACQVKPFSLGGLVYSRICSRIAGDACTAALERNFFSEDFMAEIYDSVWRKTIGGALKKGLRMRRFFNTVRRIPVSFTLTRILGLSLLAGRVLDPDFLRNSPVY
ncbi:MAG: NAD(P)/FAD-dependent oxidoreductase [Thermoproteota archaeon]|nr:NAD(P)/FAD-dependent oxidoreductase [Candidatus Brockarchaeota archaeon]